MRFLIDECLHPTLADVVHGAGHEAQHVNYLGLASTKDHDLMPVLLEGDFIFVTNNAADFRRLYPGAADGSAVAVRGGLGGDRTGEWPDQRGP